MASNNNQNPFHNWAKGVGKVTTYTTAEVGKNFAQTMIPGQAGTVVGRAAKTLINTQADYVGNAFSRQSDATFNLYKEHANLGREAFKSGNTSLGMAHMEAAHSSATASLCNIL
jgi:hypothetical protein